MLTQIPGEDAALAMEEIELTKLDGKFGMTPLLGRDMDALERKEVTSGGKDTMMDSEEELEELCPMI